MKSALRIRLFLIAAVALLVCNVQAKELFYEVVKTVNGASEAINKIFVVPNGYVWGASNDGLIRLDYYDFNTYRAGGEENTIPGNVIYSLGTDRNNVLWISTDGGVARYDITSSTFKPYFIERDGVRVPLIARSGLDAPDFMLLGSEDALYAYDYEIDEVRLLIDLAQEPPYRVDAIFKNFGDEYLLFNKDRGFLCYSLKRNEVYKSTFDISGSSRCFWMDSKHRFWRSVYNKGIECYDADGKLLTTYTTSNSGLNCDIVNCITERNGEIWAGTSFGGINIINPDNREVTVLKKDPSNHNSFPSNTYTSLFCDGNGNVWATTGIGNVVVFRDFYARVYPVYPSVSSNSNASMPVSSIVKDSRDESIWVGVYSSGISFLDVKNKNIYSIPSTRNTPLESMVQLPDGRILAYLKGSGFYLFDKKSYSFVKDDAKLGYLSGALRDSPVRVGLFSDMRGNILILSDRSYMLNPRTWQIVELPLDGQVRTEGMKSVTSGGNDYFYTERFIYVWNSREKRMEQVFDMGDETINSVSTDSRSNFWIAADNGLYYLDVNSKELVKVEGAPFECAHIVACDKLGRVWVGADGYISVYLNESDSFVLLNESDGVFFNDYEDAPVILTDDGYIYFGGRKGIVQIDLSITFDEEDIVELILQDVFVDEVKVDATSTIKIDPKQNHIEIDLFARSSNVLQKRMYRFKVNGPNSLEEIYTSTKPVRHFHYIQTGQYRVSAACTTRGGEWTEWREVLSFRINPVWYLSFWFILSLTIVIIAIVILTIWLIERRKNYQLRHKSDEDRVKFLLNVSHELKTPLTLIIGLLDRVMRSGRVDAENEKRLSSTRRQALRMRTLILTVLDAHKIEEGVAVLNAEPVQFNNWVSHICEAFREEMESRGIQLNTDYDSSIGMVDIDANKLENVLTNILINALKHSPNDTVVTLVTRRNSQDDTLRVSVSDMGPGLEGVDMSKLFSRYYQGVTEKTGSGMGLAYANTIVELHNGKMGAEDNPGGGAVFYFDLPMKSSASAAEEVSQPVSVRAAGVSAPAAPVATSLKSLSVNSKALSGVSLLLVDDDNDLRQYISEELTDIVSKVYTAVDGVDALKVISHSKDIDIVVTDINMPNMNGFELCSKIKDSPETSHILVVMLTTRTDAESNRAGLACGADEYVTKPFDITTLTDTLSSLLRRQ